MGHKDKLAPFGILNMMTGLLTVIFGVSFDTAQASLDFMLNGKILGAAANSLKWRPTPGIHKLVLVGQEVCGV